MANREERLFTGGTVVFFTWQAEEGWPVEHVSPNITQFGYEPDDFISGRVPYSSIIHPDDCDRVAAEVQAYSASGVLSFEQDYRIVRRDGVIQWVYDFTTIVRDEHNTITHYDGYILDITERKKMEEALCQSEERFRTVADFTYDWEYWISPQGDLIYVSPSCERITGYHPQAFQDNPRLLEYIIHSDDRLRIIPHFHEENSLAHVYETEFRIISYTGDIRWIGHICQAVHAPDGRWLGRRASNRDITQRKQAEEALRQSYAQLEERVAQRTAELKQTEQQLRKANSNLKTLSACNQALIHATDENQLLHNICDIIVQTGGYAMAWVGFAEPEGKKRVYPVAQVGDTTGYLESIYITWDETSYGAGPTGTAIRTGQPCVVKNIETDATYAHWREHACQRGYASSIALPLIHQEENLHIPALLGALNMYAQDVDAFGDTEIALLTELAADVVYGITTLRTRAENQRMTARIVTILETITDGFLTLDTDWRFVYVNREAELILRKPREELIGYNVWEKFPETVNSIFYTQYHQAMDERVAVTFETFYTPLGIWLEVRAYPSQDGLSSYFRDITERKQAERELQRVNRALKTLSECNQVLVRAEDETALLHNICQGIVYRGGYRMAWVGLAEYGGEQRVLPVAQAGYEEHYLKTINIYWEGKNQSSAPAAIALRTKQPAVVRDILTDPTFPEWRDDALARGYASCIALPFTSNTDSDLASIEPFSGALVIYAQEQDAFDAAEIDLLTELANDLAYGMSTLRMRVSARINHERLQTLSRRMVEIQETERRTIARELHDEVGQALTGLHLLLEMISRFECKNIGTKLQEAHAIVSDLMSRVRELSLNLRPAMLDDLGLLPTLRWFFNRYTSQTTIRVLFKHTDMQQRFAAEVETVVYRLIQEALTNVARYAQVNEVTVRLWGDAEALGLQIEDAGIGFDPDVAFASNTSSGLAGMQERVLLLGGEMTIESAPGQGTCIAVDVPLLPEP